MTSAESILIVDDDVDICEALKDMLELDGYNVQTVNSGYEAVEAVKRNRYCLIIVDYLMRPMSGIKTIRELRKITFETPIILMTALGKEENIIKEIKAEGVFDILHKPLNIDMMYKTISSAVLKK